MLPDDKVFGIALLYGWIMNELLTQRRLQRIYLGRRPVSLNYNKAQILTNFGYIKFIKHVIRASKYRP